MRTGDSVNRVRRGMVAKRRLWASGLLKALEPNDGWVEHVEAENGFGNAATIGAPKREHVENQRVGRPTPYLALYAFRCDLRH